MTLLLVHYTVLQYLTVKIRVAAMGVLSCGQGS